MPLERYCEDWRAWIDDEEEIAKIKEALEEK